MIPASPVMTHSRLVREFRQLGLKAGETVMLHASVKSIGWIAGGPDVVLDALREVLTPAGTLMMYIGWQDSTYHLASWSADQQAAALAEYPVFDPATSRAVREWGILGECLRTSPGAQRSGNPEASVVAIGARAREITENHPLQFGYGKDSPFERLVLLSGKVLLLGSHLAHTTLLHYSECVADIPDKITVRYRIPLLREGKRVWIDIEEYNTGTGIVDCPFDYFEKIVQSYIDNGNGRKGLIGAARSFLFEAPSLHEFGVKWMEEHFKPLHGLSKGL